MIIARILAILAFLASGPALADAPAPPPLPAPQQAAPSPQPVPRPAQLPTDAPDPAPIPDAPKSPPDGAATAQNYGARDPDCLQWTDACRTCARDEKGATQCSTPGIACTLGSVTCKVKKPPALPAPVPAPQGTKP